MAEPSQDCGGGARALRALAGHLLETGAHIAPRLDAEARGTALRQAARHLAVRAAVASWLRARGLPPARSALFEAGRPDSDSPFSRALHALENEAIPADPSLEEISPVELADLYPGLLRESRRKADGIYYTGACLSEPTARRTLAPLLARRGNPLELRVCDPAMGTGRFLLAALHLLVAGAGGQDSRTRRDVATSCLHGRDLDRTAAALAAWGLWFAVGDPTLPVADLERDVRVGDGLADLPRGTFDAVLGNPPWETVQPSAAEFFSEIDSGFRGLGKQAALVRQREILEADASASSEWEKVRGERRALAQRVRVADAFVHQGRGKLFTYRLFAEQAYHLLRDGGRLGMIVPSGLYADREAAPLRRLLLDRCRWEWLFAFENRQGLFAIDSRYRFASIVAQKGGRTRVLRAAFLRRDPAEWDGPRPPALQYSRARIRRLSPSHEALLEIRDERDLQILERMQSHGARFLVGRHASMRFSQGDFNMTSDSDRFVPRADLEAEGYRGGDDGRWRRGKGDAVYLPLFQGVMIDVLRGNAAGHVGGSGRRARWRARGPGDDDTLEPQFLVREVDYHARRSGSRRPMRLAFRTLSNATNTRTAIATLLSDLPLGNSVGTLNPLPQVEQPLTETAYGAAVMASLVWDWALRQRMSGTNLNAFLLEETTWPRADAEQKRAVATLAVEAALDAPWDRAAARACRPEGLPAPGKPASTTRRRSLLIALELLVARLFGLKADDLAWMLRDCRHPTDLLATASFTRGLDPKGFWRVDRNQPPERRLTVQVLEAVSAANGR